MTAQEVCRSAAALIREHGWVQGQIGNSVDGYCLVGALFHASHVSGSGFEAENLIREIVGSPSGWNDDPSRTVEEVLSVLDEAGRT